MIGTTVRAGPHDVRGVTLLELLVALTITGLAVSSGYAAISTLIDAHERTRAHSGDLLAAANARSAITGWLSEARLLGGGVEPDFRGLDGRDGGRDDDEVQFLTTADTPLGTATTRVRLAIGDDPDSGQGGLLVDFRDLRGRERARLLLVPGASSLDIRYLSGLSSRKGWLPSWISSSLLPAAVEVRIGSGGDSIPALFRPPVFAAVRNALAL